jgi:hypothetical protein
MLGATLAIVVGRDGIAQTTVEGAPIRRLISRNLDDVRQHLGAARNLTLGVVNDHKLLHLLTGLGNPDWDIGLGRLGSVRRGGRIVTGQWLVCGAIAGSCLGLGFSTDGLSRERTRRGVRSMVLTGAKAVNFHCDLLNEFFRDGSSFKILQGNLHQFKGDR